MLLSVDPGIRGCGCALWDKGKLAYAAYVRNNEERGNRAKEAAEMARLVLFWVKSKNVTLTHVAVEWMQIYVTKLRKGEMGGRDPNDLLALTGITTAIAALAPCYTTSHLPREWKEGLSESATTARIQDRLDEDEFLILSDAATKAGGDKGHNVWDAVGIGLYQVGRFQKKRVIPG